MLSETKIEQIYEKMLNEGELTTKFLNDIGFNSMQIKKLVDDCEIVRIKRGIYQVDFDKLHHYGKELLFKKNYSKATKCFEVCHQLKPEDNSVCFQLFINHLYANALPYAYKYLKLCMRTNVKREIKDNNFYLFLLGYIMSNISSEDREYNKYLRFEDIQLTPDEDYNFAIENNIRYYALKRNFYSALNSLYQKKEKVGGFYACDIATKLLLKKANLCKMERTNNLLSMINLEQYDEIDEYFNKLEEDYTLSSMERVLQKLVSVAKSIINNKIVPSVINKKQMETLTDCIDCNDFELALSKCIEFNKKNNIANEKSTIYIMLKNILHLINKFNDINETSISNDEGIKEQSESIPNKEADSTEIYEVSSNTELNIFNIVSEITNKNYVSGLIKLRLFLQSINKEEYYELLSNTIKLCILYGDMNYIEFIGLLTNICIDKYKFNVSIYLRKFYEVLAIPDIEKAKVYLNIIKESSCLEDECKFINLLEEVLSYTNELYTGEKLKTDIVVDTTFLQNEETTDVVQLPKANEPDKKNIKPKEDNNEEVLIYNSVLKKVEKLRSDKGIILIKNMNNNKLPLYEKALDKFDDIYYFITGNNQDKIVLSYTPNRGQVENVDEIIKEVKKYLKDKMYTKALNKLKTILESGTDITFVYANIGLCYLHLKSKNKSILYLEVATEMSLHNGEDYIFYDLLSKLNGDKDYNEEDYKPKIRFKQKDFANDIDDYYGIDCIEEICKLISSGKNVDDACEELGLYEIDITLVKLILARECYINGDYDLGDKFYKLAQQSEYKDDMVITLMNSISINKKFFIHRELDTHKKLIIRKTKNES